MVTFETAEAAPTAVRAQQIVSSHGRWDVERPHSTMWYLWRAPRMPELNDYKQHRDSSGRSRPASLPEATSQVVLFSSSNRRGPILRSISRNRPSGSPQRSLQSDAEECKRPRLNPQQQPDPSWCQISQLLHISNATNQEPSTPAFGGESEESRDWHHWSKSL